MKRRAVIAGLALVLAGNRDGWAANAASSAEGSDKDKSTAGEDRPVGADRGIKQEGDARFVTLDPVLVSVLRHDDVRKLVTFMITLELSDAGNRRKVYALIPRLRDAYLSDLTRVFGLGIYDDRVVDLSLVKKRLLAVSQHVLGPEVIRDVLILNIFERST